MIVVFLFFYILCICWLYDLINDVSAGGCTIIHHFDCFMTNLDSLYNTGRKFISKYKGVYKEGVQRSRKFTLIKTLLRLMERI